MSTGFLADEERATQPPAEALSMEADEALYEFINGRRVEMPPMSIRASTVAGRLHVMINSFATPRHLGEAFIEMLIEVPVPEDEDGNRRPDVYFISSAKLAAAIPEDPDANAWGVVPDLAIEVTSFSDRAEEQREKIEEYRRLNIPYIWAVYPKLRIVDVYGPSRAVRTFGPDGVLPGDPVLPGLEIRLDELFRPIGSPRE